MQKQKQTNKKKSYTNFSMWPPFLFHQACFFFDAVYRFYDILKVLSGWEKNIRQLCNKKWKGFSSQYEYEYEYSYCVCVARNFKTP